MKRNNVWIETREKLAAIEHEQWTHWTAYFLRTILAEHINIARERLRLNEQLGAFA